MIIEQTVKALIIKPCWIKNNKVVKARYLVVEMKKYSFVANDDSPGGWVQIDELKEVSLAEAMEYGPDVYFYDDYGRYRRIFWAMTAYEDAETGYFVSLRFKFGQLSFDLEQFVDDDVPCVSQLNK